MKKAIKMNGGWGTRRARPIVLHLDLVRPKKPLEKALSMMIYTDRFSSRDQKKEREEK